MTSRAGGEAIDRVQAMRVVGMQTSLQCAAWRREGERAGERITSGRCRQRELTLQQRLHELDGGTHEPVFERDEGGVEHLLRAVDRLVQDADDRAESGALFVDLARGGLARVVDPSREAVLVPLVESGGACILDHRAVGDEAFHGRERPLESRQRVERAHGDAVAQHTRARHGPRRRTHRCSGR
jgi:hypothetical protein